MDDTRDSVEAVSAGGTRVRDVVRDVVAEAAPQELPLVDGLVALDDAMVVRMLGHQGGRREPLEFGLGEVARLVTPVVWLAVDQVARKVVESAVDGAAEATKARLRRLFRRKAAPLVIPPLTPEQLGEVRRRVLEIAAWQGLGDARATVIADMVVARLALAASERPAANGPAAQEPAREPGEPDNSAPGARGQG